MILVEKYINGCSIRLDKETSTDLSIKIGDENTCWEYGDVKAAIEVLQTALQKMTKTYRVHGRSLTEEEILAFYQKLQQEKNNAKQD